ncbi:MAG TPA: ketol-acid reductoisomerase [Gaiellaceae bacterium]|nr:ketol-acid reductoisomerase [Gaiellaceae bacterium]
MARVFHDEDADLTLLQDRTVGILGYGNQGRPQALNLRDSGISVIVGSPRDESFGQAQADGFEAYDIEEAAAEADINVLLVPDEVMPTVFEREVRPGLGAGDMVMVASGYNLYYRLLELPTDVDVTMVAPRMIGTGVRETYMRGVGFPSLISVEQDATGDAFELALAYAKGIGSTRAGVFESSAEEETICDLFNEHFGYVYELRRAYEVLTEAGCSPESVLLEFYASGEEMELARAHALVGLFHQLTLHSMTSQYGQLVTGRLPPAEDEREKNRLRKLIENIRDGSFAREWSAEQERGLAGFKQAKREALEHPMIEAERQLFERLGRRQGDPSALESEYLGQAPRPVFE